MKNLYIMHGKDYYSFDHGNDSTAGAVEVTMRKTGMGWNIEVTELVNWNENKTSFLWVANTAREAFYDCLHTLRYIERHRAFVKRV